MPTNTAAENALGTIGTVCWMIQLIPQIWKSYRDKSVEGLSPHLSLLWSVSGVFLGIYAIVQDLNIPLIIQPQIFTFLCSVNWIQCQYYGSKRPLRTCVVLFIVMILFFGGLEAGMVFAVRPSFRHGHTAGTKFFGILSSVTLSVALLPQYYEIYKHREVIGISVLFMFIDMMGGVFSDLSLVFKSKFDVIAGVAYSLVVVLDGLVLLAALILNPLAARRRRRAKAESHESNGEIVANAPARDQKTQPSESSPHAAAETRVPLMV